MAWLKEHVRREAEGNRGTGWGGMVRFRRRRKDVRAGFSAARAREREEDTARVSRLSRARACVRIYMCTRARKASEMEYRRVGRGRKGAEEEKERERSANSRVRPCGRHRNLEKKEKRDKRNRGRGVEEGRREERKEAKSSFVVHVCHTYVYAKMKETGEERDETSNA